jgi:TonB family protein
VHRHDLLVGRHARRGLAQARLLVPGSRLSRVLGTSLAVSLALHASVLAAIAPGAQQPGSQAPTASALQVRLAEAAKPVPPKPRTARSGSPRYLASSELDERAAPLELAPLVYPEKAYLNRIPGTVRVRVFISRAGAVDRAEIVAASPAGHFEAAALEAVRRSRFSAGRKDGQAVPSQKVIEVSFEPYGAAPEGEQPKKPSLASRLAGGR